MKRQPTYELSTLQAVLEKLKATFPVGSIVTQFYANGQRQRKIAIKNHKYFNIVNDPQFAKGVCYGIFFSGMRGNF